MRRTTSESRSGWMVVALVAALACTGPAGPPGPPGPAADAGTVTPPGTQGVIDYTVMTPQELQDSKIAVTLTGSGITIPADGRPVVTWKITERHGFGVKGMSTTV